MTRFTILGLQEVAHFQFRAGGRGNQEIRGGDRRQEHKIRQGQSSLIVESDPVASTHHAKDTTRVDMFFQKWGICIGIICRPNNRNGLYPNPTWFSVGMGRF